MYSLLQYNVLFFLTLIFTVIFIFFCCKARDALMWNCLRRKQRDELQLARTRATNLLSAHLLRLTATRGLLGLRSSALRLLAAVFSHAKRREFVGQWAAGRRVGAAMVAWRARGEWVGRRCAVGFLMQAVWRCICCVLCGRVESG